MLFQEQNIGCIAVKKGLMLLWVTNSPKFVVGCNKEDVFLAHATCPPWLSWSLCSTSPHLGTRIKEQLPCRYLPEY